MNAPVRYVFLSFALTAIAYADPQPEPGAGKITKEMIAKAEKAVKDHLTKINGQYARVTHISDASVDRTLPGTIFFSVLFPQFPVGRVPPEGLGSSNVFVVSKDKVTALADHKSFEKFFREKATGIKGKERAVGAAEAWVRLAQEFKQDGFYKFVLEKTASRATESGKLLQTEAKTVVMAGGNGYLTVKLGFDESGTVKTISESSTLRPGPRPRCQATKLLDNDPIVRAMAEQELLYLGRSAKDYLDEQRRKASPELKKAIDRLWQKIIREKE